MINRLIVMAPTESKETPTFPYRKNGTPIHRNFIFVHLASTNLTESNGSTSRQKIKSATQRLEKKIN